MDTYWGIQEVQKNPFKFLLFGTYFPLLTSGPIIRYKEFSEKLYRHDSFSYYKFCFGLQRILWGIFKKIVISERLAVIVNTIYGDLVTYRGLFIWFAMACFVLQLYTDFSGCLDLLYGVSELFGIELPENFNMPFTSRNISEFWRRWHITLGLWLKDYVLYPILKSRPLVILGEKTRSLFGKRIGKKIPVWCGLFITWFLIGFWHGGSWNYIIGVGLWMWFIIVLSDISDPILKKTTKILHIKTNCFSWYILQSLRTFLIFMFGLGMFPVSSFSSGIKVYRAAFDVFNLNIFFDGSLLGLGLKFVDYIVLIVSLIILISMGIIKLVSKVSVREWISIQNLYFRWAIWIFLIVIVLVYGKYGIGYDVSNFIYGGF